MVKSKANLKGVRNERILQDLLVLTVIDMGIVIIVNGQV